MYILNLLRNIIILKYSYKISGGTQCSRSLSVRQTCNTNQLESARNSIYTITLVNFRNCTVIVLLKDI